MSMAESVKAKLSDVIKECQFVGITIERLDGHKIVIENFRGAGMTWSFYGF